MNQVDLLLNLACLALWITWRAKGFTAAPANAWTWMQQIGPPRNYRNGLLLALALLLLVRAWVYWQVGSQVNWVAVVNLAILQLPFKSLSLVRMLVYSFLAFGVLLVVFYMWLILLSLINTSLADSDPFQRRVRLHLGLLERLPLPLKLLFPLALVTVVWRLAFPALVELALMPPAHSSLQVWEQGVVLGLAAFLSWKYLLAAILLFYVLNSYLYLGNHPIWQFITATGRNLLRPLNWLPLRVGTIDLAPVVGMALTFLALQLGQQGLSDLFQQLPL